MDKTRLQEIDYNINYKYNKSGKLSPWIIQENKVAYYCKNYIKSLVNNNTYHKFIHEAPTPSQGNRLEWLKITKTTIQLDRYYLLKTSQNITWLKGLKNNLKLVSMTSLVFHSQPSLLAEYIH